MVLSGKAFVQTYICIITREKHTAKDSEVSSEQEQNHLLSLLVAGIAGRKMKGKIYRYFLSFLNSAEQLSAPSHTHRDKSTLSSKQISFANTATVSKSLISADVFPDCFHL